ncbi:hypothetical protein [Nitrosospira sp. Nsp1]|uniref:hypothetical protein n=1 Tax=Nitrosospira sp. Nsp1 TaxID=136547 RepID=UPI0008900D2B|nr:hypothetical protein [Nitrosospira sp. Nsp1]SCX52274.1 hypothetical protein SAMN05720354_111101 [Nitrosospira sp. Nsp1]
MNSILALINSTEFVVAINSVFFIGISYVWIKARKAVLRGRQGAFVEYAPSLMTSLGILGTFLGIVIGLLLFDPTDIDKSIESLLGGLKTAFITSLIGMGATITFKWWHTHYLAAQQSVLSEAVIEEVGPSEIYTLLNKQCQATESLVRAIGGDNERSIIGQLQMLRTDITDFRSVVSRRQESFEEKLWSKLQEFAEMLSKSATEQVIEALRQVIIDFNQRLTEQFGENFKRLDESVKKLVDWQAQYMKQMEEMTALYSQGVASIDLTRVAVEGIRQETSRIPVDMQFLGEVLQVNQHQIRELTNHLDVFVKMRDQAITAVPTIQLQLQEVGNQMKAGAEQMRLVLLEGATDFKDSVTGINQSLVKTGNEISTHSESISEELTNSLDLLALNTERIQTGITSTIATTMDSVEDHTRKILNSTGEVVNSLVNSVRDSSENTLDGVEKSRQTMMTSLETINETIIRSAEKSLGGVEKQVQEAVARTGEAVNVQLRAVDEALERQLNIALEQLGSALATIAKHLIDTYQQKAQKANVFS